MELRNQQTVASVRLFEVVVSESELEVYDAALAYLLSKLSERDCVGIAGETREEIDGMLQDIGDILHSAHDAVAGSTKER